MKTDWLNGRKKEWYEQIFKIFQGKGDAELRLILKLVKKKLKADK